MGKRTQRVARATIGATALLLCGLCATPPRAAAQTDSPSAMPKQARLFMPSCKNGPFDRATFLEVLKLELASHDITLVTKNAIAWPSDTARIVIDVDSCRAAAERATIEISKADNGARAQRDLVFTLPERDRRARVLALATSAFLTLKWPTLVATDDETEARALAELEARLRESQRQDLEELIADRPVSTGLATSPSLVSLSIAPQFFAEFSSIVLGPSVAFSHALRDYVRLEVGATTGFGRNRALDGNVKIRTVDLSLAALFGGGRRAWVGVGPRASVGWARLRGDARDSVTLMIEEDQISRATGSLALQLGLRVRLAKQWHAMADTYAGYGFQRVEGRTDDGVRGGVGGSLIGIVIGAAYGFD